MEFVVASRIQSFAFVIKKVSVGKGKKGQENAKKRDRNKERKVLIIVLLFPPCINPDDLLNKSIPYLPILPSTLDSPLGSSLQATNFTKTSHHYNLTSSAYSGPTRTRILPNPQKIIIIIISPPLPKGERTEKPQITEESFLSSWKPLKGRKAGPQILPTSSWPSAEQTHVVVWGWGLSSFFSLGS